MIASACRNSLFDLFTSLSGYVSCVSGSVGYESFASQVTMDRCTMRRCTTADAQLSVMPRNLSACLTSSHLLHLYLGQILSWKVQKCGVSSTLSCHYDPRKGLSVDVRVFWWSGSYTLGDDYTKMKESGCHLEEQPM